MLAEPVNCKLCGSVPQRVCYPTLTVVECLTCAENGANKVFGHGADSHRQGVSDALPGIDAIDAVVNEWNRRNSYETHLAQGGDDADLG